MQNTETIRAWIQWVANQRPANILRAIQQGDMIVKAMDYRIIVDDIPSVINKFQARGGIDIGKIHEHFTKQLTKATKNTYYERKGFLHEGNKCVRLTQLIQDQVGECTEMATIVQIMAQDLGRESYWVTGVYRTKTDLIDHVWNIILKDNEFHIFDIALLQILKITEIKDSNGIIEIHTEGTTEIKYTFN